MPVHYTPTPVDVPSQDELDIYATITPMAQVFGERLRLGEAGYRRAVEEAIREGDLAVLKQIETEAFYSLCLLGYRIEIDFYPAPQVVQDTLFVQRAFLEAGLADIHIGWS